MDQILRFLNFFRKCVSIKFLQKNLQFFVQKLDNFFSKFRFFKIGLKPGLNNGPSAQPFIGTYILWYCVSVIWSLVLVLGIWNPNGLKTEVRQVQISDIYSIKFCFTIAFVFSHFSPKFSTLSREKKSSSNDTRSTNLSTENNVNMDQTFDVW